MGQELFLVAKKKKRGRPPTGIGTPVQVRLQDDHLAALDAYIAQDDDTRSRPEAIRSILGDYLRRRGYL